VNWRRNREGGSPTDLVDRSPILSWICVTTEDEKAQLTSHPFLIVNKNNAPGLLLSLARDLALNPRIKDAEPCLVHLPVQTCLPNASSFTGAPRGGAKDIEPGFMKIASTSAARNHATTLCSAATK
jgi:hypothetical protein